ncbi:twin-arginine translocase subunit TatC [Seleniivibrio sp.]|uniref:twin-arginine translocase subunit TatC n=1 Tax=Seleniivibrio sp. TaxID=2898801 RepID=UPI0025E92189|nr:twin-arginine translocase subunit TatC [Seleniivibrio sp.]MCD8553187.1 twin-arginine translocase subunit TatC [Seleniivibrio sp.]
MPNEKDTGVEAKQPLMEHLEELRKRLIRIFIIVIIVFCAVYSNSKIFMDFVTAPVIAALPPHASLSMIKITEGFFVELKLCAVVAVFFSMPAIFYELWKFIAPGLYAQEKKYIVSFVISATLLFIGGAAFAYYGAFPFGFKFFLGYAQGSVTATLSLQEYLGFFTKMIMAFGFVFEMPVFTFFLAKMGFLTSRMMNKYRKYSYLGIFIIAAILTPPDVFSQMMMACPMMILYEVSVFVAKVFGRKREIKEEDVYA